MDDIFVGSLMSSPVRTVSREASLQAAGQLMLDHGIGSVIVVDVDARIDGILTATDFIRKVATDDPSASTVAEYMSRDVTTTTADESLQTVADKIIEHGFHHVPVVDEDDAVIGVITTTDLTGYLSQKRQPSPA